MARRCSICGKKYNIATNWKKVHSKYDPVSRKRQYPNLQWTVLPVPPLGVSSDGRIKACAKCIRTLEKTREKTTRAQRLRKRLEKLTTLHPSKNSKLQREKKQRGVA